MLLEMDERLRNAQRLAATDMDARRAYYASVARSGDLETIRNLSMLGDEEAQAISEPTTHPDVWSLQTRLEQDVHNAQARSLAIMIMDELVDAYEERLDELVGDPSQNIDPANPVFFEHYQQGLETIKRYYDRYNALRRNEGTHNNFSNLEYELGGETNAGGRLYGMNGMTTINSMIGVIGLACLVRTSDFSEGANAVTGRWSPGMARYLGNALGSAQGQGIHTSEIMGRIRQRLQSQLF
jgi:hypothetical protein